MKRIMLVVLAVSAAAAGLPAGAQEAGTPDGRVRVELSQDASPDSVRAGARGNAGAFGFDNEIDGRPDRLTVTNPPMAGSAELDARGFRFGYQELYGPRGANASLGTGGITTGVDRQGRLTNLGWPGPGHHEHVNNVNVTRGWPNQGAPVNAGAFGGVLLTAADGSEDFTWLHPDHGWTLVDQRYASDDTQTLETVLHSDEHALTATITDVVHPSEDLVARNFAFSHDLTPAPELRFAHYANMNPTTSRAPRTPSVFDALADNVSDFGTVHDAHRSALLHFRPYTADPAALTIIATSQPGPAAALSAVAGAFGPGVYIAVAGQGRAREHQAGLEAAGLLRDEADGTPLADPFYDAASDGRLSGSAAAFGKTAGALAAIEPDPDGSFTVYLSAASHPQEALGAVDRARQQGFAALRAASEAFWRAWISRARLPATDDARTIAVSKRALMLIRTAQDRDTGAIVANATAQTPYRQDWVRDGAFFNYALLLAGYPEMVRHHNDFYRWVYRPGGTWDSFYFTDGAEAGAMFPYEIDSQAFALWALWLPYETGDADDDYLASVYPAIRDTADAIMLCHDPVTGLQCYAPEDDNPQPTQEQQGAATVYLALRAAARAADALGDGDASTRWDERADGLRAAALERLCDDERCGGGRGGIYMVWPSRLLDADTPDTAELAASHLEQYANRLDNQSSFQAPPVGGHFQYPMEPLLALAPFWRDADRDVRLGGWMRWLAHDVAEPGVLHYGERIFHCAGEPVCDGRRYLHGVGFPHIWSGAEMYIGAAFVHGLAGCPDGADRVGEAPCVRE